LNELKGRAKMSEKALIIDEDHQNLAVLQARLEEDGFTVAAVENGKNALRTAYNFRPDTIILDITMEETDGWLVCRRLRYMSDVPIIVLSNSEAERDVIKALSLGADEYLTKPRSAEEVRARVRAILRRAKMSHIRIWESTYDDGSLRIDLTNGAVMREGEVIHLTPTESRLLMYLVSRKGEVVPHRELLINAWGQEYAEAIDYLSVYIRYLREKVEQDPSNPDYIQTRWGTGYYFAGNGGFKASERRV
jgi:two-component system KDP operon response regulator KdpE